mgnify:CR=1 FL=1
MTQIDHRLILSGVQANPFGSMLQGAQTRNVMDEMRVEAKKRNFLSENGQALYQGDQNALSQYANVDIGGAMALRNQHEARQLRQEAAARARAAAGRAAGSAARRSQLAAELHESKSQLAGAQIALANGTWDEYAKSIGVPEGTDGTAFVQRGLIELQAYDEAVQFGQPSAEEAAMEAYRDIIGGEEQQAAPAPQPPTPEPMGSPSGLAGASLEHMPPVTNALAGPAGMSAPPAPPPAPERAPIPPADYGSIFGPVHASPAPGRGQAPVIPTETPSAPPAPAPQAAQQPVPQPQPQPAPQPVAAQPAQPVDPVQAMIAERARFDQALLIPNLPASAKAHAQMMIERLDGRIAEARKPKPAREMFKDANGRQRWVDDQSLVVPDLEPTPPHIRPMTMEEKAQFGLATDRDYKINTRTGDFSVIGGNSVTINNNEAVDESQFAKETGKALAVEAAEIARQGDAASRNLGSINRLEQLLYESQRDGIQSSLVNVAAGLGLKLDGASEIEAANAIISQMVPQQRPPGSGPMSDADLELFKQSLPRLINSADGNRMIIDTMRALAEYDQGRGKIARQQQLGKISHEQAIQQYAQLNDPLKGFLGSQYSTFDTPKVPHITRFNQLLSEGLDEDAVYKRMAEEGYE